MTHDAFEKVLKISEEFFGTAQDPDQMPITRASADKLLSIHPDSVIYKFDGEGNPIAWMVTVPTSTEVMERFLKGDISERELLDEAARDKKFEALYLCGAFVLPEYRKKGYAKELSLEAIRTISAGKELPLYAWIYSPEGKKLADSVSKALGRSIRIRNKS